MHTSFIYSVLKIFRDTESSYTQYNATLMLTFDTLYAAFVAGDITTGH